MHPSALVRIPRPARPRFATPGPGPTSALLLALALVTGSHLLLADLHLDLSDEGFLWYGVQRTAAGEVPLRDFQSYEPGRYYWGAAWSLLLGDGILALRAANAIFQALGLACGLLLARRVVPHPLWLLPTGALLAAWMFPAYKMFEPALSLMATYFGVRLVEAPSRRAHFLAGVFVGAAAFFGRNHALYAGLGVLLLTGWLHVELRERRLVEKLAIVAAGTALGASPLIGMLFFVPGFAASLLDSLRFFLEQGSNLPLPVPWPWRVQVQGSSTLEALAHVAVAGAFLLLFLVPPFGLLAAALARRGSSQRPVLLAAAAIGLFYAHHAAVRSDPNHLAQAIQPALLACLAIPGALGWRRHGPTLLVWAAMASLTLPVVARYHAPLAMLLARETLVPYRVGDDVLRLRRPNSDELSRIQWVIERRVPEDEKLFIAPHAATLYPLLGRTAPVWGLYFLWPADAAREAALIRSLDGVDWALIADVPLDGRQALRFRHSHRRVWRYLEREFEPVFDLVLPHGWQLRRRRTPDASLSRSG